MIDLYTSRKDLLVKMHYFIHLNLAVTLCLAYTLFLVGGPTAIAIRVSELHTAIYTLYNHMECRNKCMCERNGLQAQFLCSLAYY